MRNRRLFILLGLVVLLVAAAAGAFFLRQRTLDQRALAARAVGMEAAKAGDNLRTLDQVGRYLLRFGQDDDADAIYTYANARAALPLPNNKHTLQAIALLRQALAVDPKHAGARKRLLELYLSLGYGEESLDLAQKILSNDPTNIDALLAEATAYGWRGDYEEALKRSAAIAAAAPGDLQNHLLMLTLLDRSEAGDRELLDYAENKTGLDPNDPKSFLIRSAAYELTGDREAASQWALRAAENAPIDADFIGLVNAQLNAFGKFDASLDLLKRTAAESGDIELERALVKRLYETGDLKAVVETTADRPLDAQDSTMLAIRALALGVTDAAAVEPIVAELQSRKEDFIAEAWAPLLHAMRFEGQSSARNLVDLARQGAESQPDNPYFHYIEGLGLQRLGERDLAIGAFDQARRLAPGWIDPMLQSAQLYASMGRTPEAAALAVAAVNRNTRSTSAAILAAQVIGSDIDSLSENDRNQLSQLVANIQDNIPQEPRTLPIHVELLARSGDLAAAQDAIDRAIKNATEIGSDTLVRLGRVNAKYGLGRDRAIAELLNEQGMDSPESVYARAIALHESGDTDAGRRLIETAAETHGDTAEWRMAHAQFLDRVGSEEAAQLWAQIGDATPDNPLIQRRILDSQLAWEDHDLIRRAIDRLKEAAGEDGVAWRIAQARWLLDTDPSEKAAAEASVLLNEAIRESVSQPQYHALMAAALERLGNTDAAIENLTTASRLAPKTPSLKIELARLLQAKGDTIAAERLIDEAVAAEGATGGEKRRMAALLVQQNQFERAIQLLLETYPESQREHPPDFDLARLYRQTGKLAQAEAICAKLLEREPTSETVQLTADVYAALGRSEDADRVLELLDTLELPDGMREMILAEHYRKHPAGEDGATRVSALYKAAVQKAGTNADWWRRYLAFAMTPSEPSDVVTLIEEAHRACPADQAITALHTKRRILTTVQPWPVAARILKAGLEDQANLDNAIGAVDALSQYTGDLSAMIAQLRQRAERNPRFLPLRVELIRLYAHAGRNDEAARLASAAAREFPNAPEPPWLASEAYGAIGQWDDAEDAAREWRSRVPDNPFAADLMIATAQIRRERYNDALRTVAPYLDQEDTAPFSQLRVVQAEALVATGRLDEARALMTPHLADSAPWRREWMRDAQTYLDIEQAGDWFEYVKSRIPAGDVDENVALAVAYYNAGRRLDHESFVAQSRDILERLVDSSDANAQLYLSLAIVCEAQDDVVAAESNYRRALDEDQNLGVAANNLAMVLVNSNRDLDEALAMARKAVEIDPENANYRDTLAQCYRAQGDAESAANSLRKAIELDPSNDKWRQELDKIRQ